MQLNKIMNKQPFLEFLKELSLNPIVVPKTDSGRYAISFTKVWYLDHDFDEWMGFMVYATSFGEAMLLLEEIYYNHEIKIEK